MNALGVTARQITRIHAPRVGSDNGNLGNFEAVDHNGTAFTPKQCLYQKVAVGMENPKMQTPSGCNKLTERYGPANNPDSFTACRADNGNLGNFEAVDHNGTVFAPKQCLYPKVAMGLENPKNPIAFSVQ